MSIASGQGTKNILVNYGTGNLSNRTLSVRASNSCGIAPVRSMGGITINTLFCGSRLMGENEQTAYLNTYPNPAADLVNIAFESTTSGQTTVGLYGLDGKLIMMAFQGVTEMGQSHEVRLDVKDVPEGIYLVRMFGESMNETRKLVISR